MKVNFEGLTKYYFEFIIYSSLNLYFMSHGIKDKEIFDLMEKIEGKKEFQK